MPFGTIEQAIEDIRAGKVGLVADDEDRENEGDLVHAAQHVTPEKINFMLEAKGWICLALTPERCEELELGPMSRGNTEAMKTAFTVTIDASPRFGVTTGISAADRAATSPRSPVFSGAAWKATSTTLPAGMSSMAC